MNTTLTHYQQRGTLTYTRPDFTHTTVEGWFYLNRDTVIMRKIGGRNQYQLCGIDTVHDFTPKGTNK